MSSGSREREREREIEEEEERGRISFVVAAVQVCMAIYMSGIEKREAEGESRREFECYNPVDIILQQADEITSNSLAHANL